MNLFKANPESENNPFSFNDHLWSASRGSIYGGVATTILGGLGFVAGAPVSIAIGCELFTTFVASLFTGLMSEKEGVKVGGDFTRFRSFKPVSAGLAAVQALTLSFAIAAATQPPEAPTAKVTTPTVTTCVQPDCK